jgi:PIN domain nuclease of toxin-antitoxin system
MFDPVPLTGARREVTDRDRETRAIRELLQLPLPEPEPRAIAPAGIGGDHLDTQVALWWLTASPRLSKPSRELMAGSPCVVSVASIWEVALKHRLGKRPVSPRRFCDEMRSAGAVILSVNDEHVLATTALPEAHRDPFDRLLFSVAEAEHLVLLTADSAPIALARKEPRLPLRSA